MRALLIAFLVIALALVGALAYVNGIWIPTAGKPRLERVLTERTTLHVTIGHLSYRFPLGWVAADVQLADPAQRIPPLTLHHVYAQVAWWPLAHDRRIDFLMFARLQSPATVNGTIRGRYDWRTQALSAHLRIPLLELSALHSGWLSRQSLDIRHATLMGDVDLTWIPPQPLQLAYTTHVTDVEAHWQDPAIGLQAKRIDVEGHAAYDTQRNRWTTSQAVFKVARGQMHGPRVLDAQELTASGFIAGDQLTDLQVHGQWWGVYPMELTGSLQHWAHPEADLVLKMQGALNDRAYSLLPKFIAAMNPEGHVSVTARWHGPISRASVATVSSWPLTATAVFEGGQLQIPGLQEPVTAIHATVEYQPDQLEIVPLACTYARVPYTLTARVTDLTTQPHLAAQLRRATLTSRLDATLLKDRVSIARFIVAVHASQLTATGEITQLKAPELHLHGDGALELADLQEWPAFAHALHDWPLRGRVPLTWFLTGPIQQANALQGGLQLSTADLQIRDLPLHLDRAELQWQNARLTLQTLQARVADGALVVTGSASVPMTQGPCPGTLSIDRMHLEPVLRTLWPNQERYATGLLVTRASLTGERCTPDALRGTGEFQISEGNLASVPLLDQVFWGLLSGLAERLGYTELRHAELTQVSGRWTLAEGKVYTNDTQLMAQYAGSPIPIQLKGWVGLDQRLDLSVDAQLPQDLLQTAPNLPSAVKGMARAVVALGDVKRLIGRQHITGTLQQPQSRFEFSWDELLKRLPLQGLEQLLFPPKESPQP